MILKLKESTNKTVEEQIEEIEDYGSNADRLDKDTFEKYMNDLKDTYCYKEYYKQKNEVSEENIEDFQLSKGLF